MEGASHGHAVGGGISTQRVDVPIDPEKLALFDALPDKTRGSKETPWTKEEEAILLRYWNSKRQADIAKALGRGLHVCRRRYEKLMVPKL